MFDPPPAPRASVSAHLRLQLKVKLETDGSWGPLSSLDESGRVRGQNSWLLFVSRVEKRQGLTFVLPKENMQFSPSIWWN